MQLRLVPGLLPEEPYSEHSPSWLNLSTDADEDEAAGKDASPRLVTNTDPEPAA